jgi:hypothetical protein
MVRCFDPDAFFSIPIIATVVISLPVVASAALCAMLCCEYVI